MDAVTGSCCEVAYTTCKCKVNGSYRLIVYKCDNWTFFSLSVAKMAFL